MLREVRRQVAGLEDIGGRTRGVDQPAAARRRQWQRTGVVLVDEAAGVARRSPRRPEATGDRDRVAFARGSDADASAQHHLVRPNAHKTSLHVLPRAQRQRRHGIVVGEIERSAGREANMVAGDVGRVQAEVPIHRADRDIAGVERRAVPRAGAHLRVIDDDAAVRGDHDVVACGHSGVANVDAARTLERHSAALGAAGRASGEVQRVGGAQDDFAARPRVQ
jgi:hypothetical protein